MKNRIEQKHVPEEFDEWTLFESVFTKDHVALVYRYGEGSAWCVAEQVDDACYATLFLDGDKENNISIKAQSLLVVLGVKIGWPLTRINNTIQGGAAEVYDYVEY